MVGHHVTRRRTLKAVGAAGIAGVAGCIEGDVEGDAEGTIRIGILQPLTGDLEYYGQTGLWGFLSGLAYKFDDDPLEVDTSGLETIEHDGVTYELYIEDTRFEADTAQDVATDLVDDDEVDVLFGTTSSESARTVIETVTQPAEVPTIIGPAAESFITAEADVCSDYVFRASEDTAMDARSGGRYVATETDVEAVYIMAADYSFGHAVADNYTTVLEEHGVEVVDTRFVPDDYAEFDGLYDEAVSEGADAVVGGFTVATLPEFLGTGLEYDLRMFGGFAELITNMAVGEVIRGVIGEEFTAEDIQDAKLGPFTTRYHWNQYDNEINDWLVETHTETYGVVPDLFTSGTFVAGSSLVQAIEESGSLDGEDIADALKGMTVEDTPKGEDGYVYQEHNNQAASSMTIADPVPTSEEWAEHWQAAIMPSEPIEEVPGEEAVIPADDPEMECDLA